MKLRDHQIKAVAESPDKWSLFFRQRVGKTPTAIRLACSRAKSALIISPKSVVSHWHREIEVWKEGNCTFNVQSREQFRKLWKDLPGADYICVDEVHAHFANYKNQAFKALIAYIKKWNPKYIFLLTGTPLPSSHWAIYSYGMILGKKWPWYSWMIKFDIPVRMGARIIYLPKPKMDKELQTIIRKIGTVIDLKDVVDVPEDEEIIETFALNAKQKILIKESFDPLPIVRFSSQHQLEQAVKKGNGYEPTISFECDKDKRLLEIVKDTEKVIVVCRYHDQINKYYEMFKCLNRNTYKISGQEKLTASEISVQAENDPTAIVIVQGDTCLGYSLKSFNVMVFASMSFSFVNLDQLKFRTKSMDKKTPCQYIYLLTEGKSVDRGVYEAVIKKQDFSLELFSKSNL